MAKRSQILSFAGGLWFLDPDRRLALPPDALTEATNLEYLVSGGVRGRRGSAVLGTLPVTAEVLGIWRHYPRASDTQPQTLVVARVGTGDVRLYKADGASGTFTQVASGLPDADEWSFVNWPAKDSTFLTCSTPGGLFQWNGSTLTTIATVPVGERLPDPEMTKPEAWLAAPEWQHDAATGRWKLQSSASSGSFDLVTVGIGPLTPGAPHILSVQVINLSAAKLTPKIIQTDATGNSIATTLPDITSTGTFDLPFTASSAVLSNHEVRLVLTGTLTASGSGTRISLERASLRGSTPSGVFGDLGPYATLHKSQLYITRNSELSFSVYASEIGSATAFPPTQQLSVNDLQGGRIVGLASFFDVLLIFKQTSIFRFLGSATSDAAASAQLSLLSDIGCVAPRSIAVTPFGVFFVGRSGIYLTDGIQPEPVEVSRPISALFTSPAGDNVYSDAVGVWYPKKQQYIVRLRPNDPHVYVLSKTEIVAENVFTGERSRIVLPWAKHTPVRGTRFVVWDSERDDGRLVSGDAGGTIRIHDTGSTDEGATYAMDMETGLVSFDAPGEQFQPSSSRRRSAFADVRPGLSRMGHVRRVRVLHRANHAISGFVRYGNGATAPFVLGDMTDEQKFAMATLTDRALYDRFAAIHLTIDPATPTSEVHAIDIEARLRAPHAWRGPEVPNFMIQMQGRVTISGLNTEATVTLSPPQPDSNYEVAFGIEPSSTALGPTSVGIKPGTRSATGFTIQLGGAPGTGRSYVVSWILARAA